MIGLGARITIAAKRLGRNATELLAQKIGVASNTVSRWAQERTTPSDQHLEAIASAAGIRLEWLKTGIGSPDFAPDEVFETAFSRGLDRYKANQGFDHMAEPDQSYTSVAGIIAIRSTAPANGGGFTIDSNAGQLRRPHALLGIDAAYAIRMPDSSMAERHRKGEPLFIHPHRPAASGDSVLVLTRASSSAPVTAWLRELVSHSDASTIVRQLRPDAVTEFSGPTIIAIHKVLSPDDLFAL